MKFFARLLMSSLMLLSAATLPAQAEPSSPRDSLLRALGKDSITQGTAARTMVKAWLSLKPSAEARTGLFLAQLPLLAEGSTSIDVF